MRAKRRLYLIAVGLLPAFALLSCGDDAGSAPDAMVDAGSDQLDAAHPHDASPVPDAHTGPCQGACDQRAANECTCAPADPCGWQADGTCDDDCRHERPGDHFDDLADCDADQDGLYDGYEFDVARQFEPYLWIALSEEGFRDDRLPHFAVEPFGTDKLSVFYALSYYEDYGDKDLGGLTSHFGDSEFIVVDLALDVGDEWIVDRLFLSAHYRTLSDASGWFAAYEFQTHVDGTGQAHPVVYVSEWKHANYRSLQSCDLGAMMTDHCEEGLLERVGIAADRNVGNLDHQLLDEVVHDSNSEFYWTDIRFCGWRVASTDNADRGDCPGQNSTYADWLGAWLTDDL